MGSGAALSASQGVYGGGGGGSRAGNQQQISVTFLLSKPSKTLKNSQKTLENFHNECTTNRCSSVSSRFRRLRRRFTAEAE